MQSPLKKGLARFNKRMEAIRRKMATYAVAEPADDGEESDPDAVYDYSSFNPAYFAEIIAEKQAARARGARRLQSKRKKNLRARRSNLLTW